MATAKKAATKKITVTKAAAKKTAAKTPAKKIPTPRGRAQDRRLVAGKQKHEVAYEAKKKDVSPGIVEQVVKAVGSARQKVEATIESFVKDRKPPAKAKRKG